MISSNTGVHVSLSDIQASHDALEEGLFPVLKFLSEAKEIALEARASGFAVLKRERPCRSGSNITELHSVLQKIAESCERIFDLRKDPSMYENGNLCGVIARGIEKLEQDGKSIHPLRESIKAVEREIELKRSEYNRVMRRVSELQALSNGDPDAELAAEYRQVYADYVANVQNLAFITHQLSCRQQQKAAPETLEDDSSSVSEDIITTGESIYFQLSLVLVDHLLDCVNATESEARRVVDSARRAPAWPRRERIKRHGCCRDCQHSQVFAWTSRPRQNAR